MPYAADPRFKHAHQVRIRFRDTDSQGVVNYANYYFFFAEAIFEYYRDLAVSLRSLNDQGLDMVVAHSGADYLGNAGLESLLTVWTRIARIGRSSLTNEHLVVDEAGRVLVRGKVVQVVVDIATGQVAPVPDQLRGAVRALEGADLEV